LKEPLKLKDKTPLASGTHRLLFDVKGSPGLLVKVMRSPEQAPPAGLRKQLKLALQRFSRYGRFRFLFREYHYYVRSKLAAAEAGVRAPIAEVRGLVATDLGIGMLAEKIIGPDGLVAPPLSMLHEDGRLIAYLPMLDAFAQRLFTLDIVANDINDGNIVLGLRRDEEEFVLVDGLGDSHLIPLRSWWPWFNRRSLNKRLHKLAARIDHIWDPDVRCFRQIDAPLQQPTQ